MDVTQYCLLVYVQGRKTRRGIWTAWQCVTPDGETPDLPADVAAVKVRYCHTATMICSTTAEAFRKKPPAFISCRPAP